MTQRDSHGRFIKATFVDMSKGMKGKQMNAYYDALTALSRAVAQAESDVRRYDAVS